MRAIDGVTFTGSTATAQAIHRAMAAHLAPDARLIAETGGFNAMIVDSTALPEQADRRHHRVCLPLRRAALFGLANALYVQEDIAARISRHAERRDGRAHHRPAPGPADRSRPGDLGGGQSRASPRISLPRRARAGCSTRTPAPATGHFVGPALIDLPGGIGDLHDRSLRPRSACGDLQDWRSWTPCWLPSTPRDLA